MLDKSRHVLGMAFLIDRMAKVRIVHIDCQLIGLTTASFK
jgi:hypothetical protein